MRRAALVAALLSMVGCTPLPDSYRVPEQRMAKDGPEPEPLGRWIRFSDVWSQEYVVSGFLPSAPEDSWRWASTAPTVRVRVSDTKGLRLRLNFAFPDDSHKPLLPITVKYFVNDHPLETVVYRRAGVQDYRKAVPAEWLKTDGDNLIRWEVDPVYVAKADGVKLSMIVAEVGLERNE